METDDYEKNVIQPVIQGTVGIMRSASKEPSIMRLVITSSAITLMSWNDFLLEGSETVFDATSTTTPPKGPYTQPAKAYDASKVFALHATKEILEREKPHYDVINILPSFIIGKNELITDPTGSPLRAPAPT